MIEISCSQCEKQFKLKDTAAGKSMNCTCGNVIKIPALQENQKKENTAEAVEDKKGSRAVSRRKQNTPDKQERDLSNSKICSKCKSVIALSHRLCPNCKFDTTMVHFDVTNKDKLSKTRAYIFYKIFMIVVPTLLLIAFSLFFKKQLENIFFVKALVPKVKKMMEEEKALRDEQVKTNPDTKVIVQNFIHQEDPYFIASPKISTPADSSLLGDHFFSIKRPGVCWEVLYNTSNKRVNRYFIEDENNKIIELKASDYQFTPFSTLASKFYSPTVR